MAKWLDDMEKEYAEAEKFWVEQRERVSRIAKQEEIEIDVTDQLLFDMFDYGEEELTDAEIAELLIRY